MWIAALILGFAGSLHCVGMCSPLAWMLTGAGPVLSRLAYNFGRIFTYASLGLVAGSLGSLVEVPAMQFTLSVTLGMMMITLGAWGSGWFQVSLVSRAAGRLASLLKKSFSSVLHSKGIASRAFLGMINGLLPCSLTYLGLTSCFLMEPTSGFLFMSLFGVGTLPAMIGAPAIMSRWVSLSRIRVNRFLPILLIAAGSWLVLRGYLNNHSPQAASTEFTSCP